MPTTTERYETPQRQGVGNPPKKKRQRQPHEWDSAENTLRFVTSPSKATRSPGVLVSPLPTTGVSCLHFSVGVPPIPPSLFALCHTRAGPSLSPFTHLHTHEFGSCEEKRERASSSSQPENGGDFPHVGTGLSNRIFSLQTASLSKAQAQARQHTHASYNRGWSIPL